MGSRAQVKIKETGVYLYTHWGADSLVEDVRQVIRRGERLGDPEYFTRIMFDKMSDGQHGESTGFGIGTQMAGDIEILIEIDLGSKLVTVRSMYGGKQETLSFQEFTKN